MEAVLSFRSEGPAQLEGPGGGGGGGDGGTPGAGRRSKAPRPDVQAGAASCSWSSERDRFPGPGSRGDQEDGGGRRLRRHRRATAWPSPSTRPPRTSSSTPTGGRRTARWSCASRTAGRACAWRWWTTGPRWIRGRCRAWTSSRYVSERRTGGLGVHLMGKIMDSVTFRRTARRNVCRLVKRKAGAGPRLTTGHASPTPVVFPYQQGARPVPARGARAPAAEADVGADLAPRPDDHPQLRAGGRRDPGRGAPHRDGGAAGGAGGALRAATRTEPSPRSGCRGLPRGEPGRCSASRSVPASRDAGPARARDGSASSCSAR